MKKIKMERIKRDLTQKQLSELVGISRPLYSYIETGKIQPKDNVAEKLESILNTSIDELLSEVTL